MRNMKVMRVADLRPNEWNPNQMTDAEMAELTAEVRRLAGTPKPIVVRPTATGYEIVDGEHSWRAAVSAGLLEVDCEVVAAEPFEAMRQTYMRNLHGTQDPVRVGQLFTAMMAERQLSGRALAREIGVSEGTVRNALLYAEAAELRNRYAFDRAAGPAAEVSTWSVREVRAYLHTDDVNPEASPGSLPSIEPEPREVPISTITITARCREDLGDIAGLAASIAKVGLLHPVLVDDQNVLVVGLRRLRAHELLGRDTIPARRFLGPVTDADRWRLELAENARLDYSTAELMEPIE